MISTSGHLISKFPEVRFHRTRICRLRRKFLRYQQAEIVYSLSHKKLMELANDAGAIYRMDGIVLINREIFDEYLEQFHEK